MTTAARPPAPAPAPAPVFAPAAGGAPRPAGPGGQRPVSPTARDLWRRWRVPLALAAVILLGGIVIALLQPGAAITAYLDPSGTGTTGAHAIADILSGRGDTVIRATSPAAAESAAREPRRGGVTLVVTSPGLLTARQLDGLALVRADLVLIGPDRTALTALAPRVGLVGPAPVQSLPPGCGLNAARLAGTADMGGAQLNLPPQPTPRRHRAAPARPALCYPTGGYPSLVRYTAAGRVITVLGAGNALTNGSLADLGNAALALNLLGGHARIVWLVPSPAPGAGLAEQRPAIGAEPDPLARLPGDDSAWHRRGAHRAVAGTQAGTAGAGTTAGRGPCLGDRGGPRRALPVAPGPRPGRRRAAGRDAGQDPARAGPGAGRPAQ